MTQRNDNKRMNKTALQEAIIENKHLLEHSCDDDRWLWETNIKALKSAQAYADLPEKIRKTLQKTGEGEFWEGYSVALYDILNMLNGLDNSDLSETKRVMDLMAEALETCDSTDRYEWFFDPDIVEQALAEYEKLKSKQ